MSMKEKRKITRIGIMEIYSHHVFVFTLARVAIAAGYDVTIYTVKRIYDNVVPLLDESGDEVTWNLKKCDESDLSFLRRTKKEIENELDLLVINSVQGYRILFFYLVRQKIKTIAGAGRISEFFGIKYRLHGHPTSRKLLQHNFTRFLLRRCLPRYRALIVHTDQARKYAGTHGYRKPILQMPFSLYQGFTKAYESTETLSFVVTGSIQKFCRDHEGVIDAFEELWKQGRSLRLTILNRPKSQYGYDLLRRMKALGDRGFPIFYYEEWVKEEEYLRVSREADFFINPLNLHYYSCGELTSGIVESVRQGKPGIYPAGYLPDPVLKSSSLFYEDLENLSELLLKLLSDIDFVAGIQHQARENAEIYSLECVAKKFQSFVGKYLD